MNLPLRVMVSSICGFDTGLFGSLRGLAVIAEHPWKIGASANVASGGIMCAVLQGRAGGHEDEEEKDVTKFHDISSETLHEGRQLRGRRSGR